MIIDLPPAATDFERLCAVAASKKSEELARKTGAQHDVFQICPAQEVETERGLSGLVSPAVAPEGVHTG